jgi:hypothetical protein
MRVIKSLQGTHTNMFVAETVKTDNAVKMMKKGSREDEGVEVTQLAEHYHSSRNTSSYSPN